MTEGHHVRIMSKKDHTLIIHFADSPSIFYVDHFSKHTFFWLIYCYTCHAMDGFLFISYYLLQICPFLFVFFTADSKLVILT